MKAFVTGATGFLGSHLVDRLLAEGHEVVCLVRPSSNLRWLTNKKVTLVEGVLEPDNAGLLKGLQNADWCFHVAGLLSTPRPEEYYQVNVGGTRHCVEACVKVAPHLQRFVLVSSIAAIGPSPNGGSVNEKTKPNPVSEYGKSKLEGERVVWEYQTKFPITIIRPPAIYGPRDSMIFPVFKLAKRGWFVLPASSQIKITMAYVEDVAAACLWAAKSDGAKNETFIVADGDRYRWHDIADCLSHLLERKVRKIPLVKSALWPIAFAEEMRAKLFSKQPRLNRGHLHQFFRSWNYDISKIKQAGFTPQFNLARGMRAAVEGYRQLGWL